MSLTDAIRKSAKMKAAEPVWKGPEVEGITFSLLSRFLVCRERFRILTIEGLKCREVFSPKMEYGNFWHTCEQHLQSDWRDHLHEYVRKLSAKFPMNRQEIDHWFHLCLIQFPIYATHYKLEDSVQTRQQLLPEYVFAVRYRLPSGRTVILRGKYDDVSAFKRKEDDGPGAWLYEHKSKSRIDAEGLERQTRYDLQTMIYMLTLQEQLDYLGDNQVKNKLTKIAPKANKGVREFYPLMGVQYNVVRRSAHKTAASFTEKILADKKEQRLNEWFGRWEIPITKGDINRFCKESFNPILEQLCDWYEHMAGESSRESPFNCRPAKHDYMVHFRYPNGIYNPMDHGGETEYDEYIATGSTAGLRKVETLFPELA
jgi:hypothetical protein